MENVKPTPQAEAPKPAVDENVVLYVDPAKRIPLVLGMFAVLFLGALTTSALNTILPVIAKGIGGLDLFSLVFVAATFGGVIAAPIAGGFINVVNRRNLFLIASGLIIAIQILHVFVPTMGVMIAVRALSAIGLSFATVSGLSIIAFIFPAKERIRWVGFFGTMLASGSFFGPLLGGFLAGGIGWQWFFYLTAAIAMVGFVIAAINLPKDNKVNRGAVKLDWGGLVLYAVLLLAAVTVISFAGKAFNWLSIATLGLIVVVVIAGFAFVKVEQKKDARAMMPMSLFRDSRFTLPFLAQFLATGAKVPFYIYLSLYLQKVLGYATTDAALVVTLFGAAAVVFSLFFAPFAARTGLVKQSAFAALVVLTAISIIAALAGFFSFYNVPMLIVMCIIWGCASTMTNTTFTMIVQTILPKEVIGIATGNIQLALSLGSMIPVAIYGAIINGYGANLNTGINVTYIVGAALGVFGIVIISMIKMPKKVG